MRSDDWQQPEGWLGLRPEAFRQPGAESMKLPVSGRPRVLVTFFGDPAKLNPLLRGLSAVDADVVVGLVTRPEEFDVDHERITFVDFTAGRGA